MGLKLRQRSVYVATIVAILALVGGFALATAFSTQSVSSTQGAVGTTVSDSAWIAGTLTNGWAGAACTTTTQATTSSATTATAYFSATTSSQVSGDCATGGYTEELVFTAPVSASQALATDTFTVYSTSSAGSGIVNTVSVSVSGASGGYTATLDLYVDYGATGPSSITVLNVAINGPF